MFKKVLFPVLITLAIALSACGAPRYTAEQFAATQTQQARDAAIDQLLAGTPAAESHPDTVQETAATTETPAAEAAPVTAACDTIESSLDNGKTWQNTGLRLDNESVYNIGDRVTFTARSVLVPSKAYNEALTADELKLVEQTWLKVRFNTCETTGIVFSGGIKVGGLTFNKGVLFKMSGVREFDLRNGEIVLWFDTEHQTKDLTRVVDQIRDGNFDIKSQLAFAVTDSLKDQLPADLMKGVQVVILP